MKQKDKVILKGQVTTRAGPEAPQRIQLFDGRFDTGYRVTKFVIWPRDNTETLARTFIGKLAISPNVDDARFWDWQDNREVAWTMSSYDANLVSMHGNMDIPTDPDKIVIEDLYLFTWEVVQNDAVDCNYWIELERVELTDAMGAVTMSSYKAALSGQTWTP